MTLTLRGWLYLSSSIFAGIAAAWAAAALLIVAIP